MTILQLLETTHPSNDAHARYDGLVGIDVLKDQLLDELALLLDPKHVDKWQRKHHPKGLPGLPTLARGTPLVLLSGEVGCGKTALATSIGSPLACTLDKAVKTFETPSDIRGHGHVGELSMRITEVFEQARAKVRQGHVYGLLVIDEADDLATARAQMQAHHEDRAGVNVLIKQLDLIVRESAPLAVLMLTNRARALDPAVVRRASLHLRFDRPNTRQRAAVFERMLSGTKYSAQHINDLVIATEPQHGVPFSFSDLTVRAAKAGLRHALRSNQPFNHELLLEAIHQITPSPLIESHSTEEGVSNG